MYWEEDEDQAIDSAGDEVVDVTFRIACRALPVDHAYPLATALIGALPWLASEPRAGIHSIHAAESGNGWMRPGNPDDLIHLSRRTRLVLRVPGTRVDDSLGLSGSTLVVAGSEMKVGEANVRPLSTLTTLFARYVATGNNDERIFLANTAAVLKDRGIRARKMMCGIGKTIRTPDDTIRTRSLMLADLAVRDSIRLQQEGLGPNRHLGCGLFIPHKDIGNVRSDDRDPGKRAST